MSIKTNRVTELAGLLTEKKKLSAVKAKWTPPEGFFNGSATSIVNGLLAAPGAHAKAMSRLNFYINRAGKNLKDEDKARLEAAKEKLSKKLAALKEFNTIAGLPVINESSEPDIVLEKPEDYHDEFGFENEDNVQKAKAALNNAGIKYSTTSAGGIVYFMFDSSSDAKKAIKLVSKVIDADKESEWKEWLRVNEAKRDAEEAPPADKADGEEEEETLPSIVLKIAKKAVGKDEEALADLLMKVYDAAFKDGVDSTKEDEEDKGEKEDK